MRIARSEREIRDFAEGKGSMDCALKAFRQGKPVLLCSSDDDRNEVLKEFEKGGKHG